MVRFSLSHLLLLVALPSLLLLHADAATAASESRLIRGAAGSSKRVDCQMSAWSPFEACGPTGYKSRTRSVLVPPSRGGSPCPATIEQAKCSATKDCWVNNWSDWLCDATTGMKQRTRTLVNQANTRTNTPGRGVKCPPLVEIAVCDPIPCEINSPAEDTSEWSECTLNRRKQWVRTKVLDVKGLRRQRMDCALYAEGMDPVAWSDCSPDAAVAGQWVQTKTLAIQTPAQYGGKECSVESRAAKQVCPPVNCKASDWSDWSACEQDPLSGNAYVRTRTRQIVTQALYGGAECEEVIFELESCAPPVCQFTEVSSACTLDNALNRYLKTVTRTIDPASLTAAAAGTGPACPLPVEKVPCDDEIYCGVVTDPAAQSSCRAAFALTLDTFTGALHDGYPLEDPVPGLTMWQCIERCAATSGCMGVDLREASPPLC